MKNMSGRSRQQESSFATKMLIAEAAAQEFAAHGYAGASLSRIAERLGLTKGALVYHFRAKSDFASYFMDVVRRATVQANSFTSETYPDCGARRLLLHFLVMGVWRRKEQQMGAGIALFADKASPAFEADEVIRDWVALSVDAFESGKSQGVFPEGMDTLEAAEMFLVTNLGTLFFGRHIRLGVEGTKPLRFVRLALTAVGVQDVDSHAEHVLRNHAHRIPKLDLGRMYVST